MRHSGVLIDLNSKFPPRGSKTRKVAPGSDVACFVLRHSPPERQVIVSLVVCFDGGTECACPHLKCFEIGETVAAQRDSSGKKR